MNGEILIRDDSINYTNINYSINSMEENSTGSIKFNLPVNMTWLSENYYDMFDVYWRDTVYNTNKQNRTLLEFNFTTFGYRLGIDGGQDNMTCNFTMTFATPYMVGLLVKKSDRLYIDVKEDFNYTGLFLGNATEHKLDTLTAKARIPLIFDFRNENMALMRQISATMYWVMLGLISIQFCALLIRNTGLLPVWIFLEYL
jgi:hypothetical protein